MIKIMRNKYLYMNIIYARYTIQYSMVWQGFHQGFRAFLIFTGLVNSHFLSSTKLKFLRKFS